MTRARAIACAPTGLYKLALTPHPMRILTGTRTIGMYTLNGVPITLGPSAYSHWFHSVYVRNRMRSLTPGAPRRFRVRRTVRHVRARTIYRPRSTD